MGPPSPFPTPRDAFGERLAGPPFPQRCVTGTINNGSAAVVAVQTDIAERRGRLWKWMLLRVGYVRLRRNRRSGIAFGEDNMEAWYP